jgi:hypothetical protein
MPSSRRDGFTVQVRFADQKSCLRTLIPPACDMLNGDMRDGFVNGLDISLFVNEMLD